MFGFKKKRDIYEDDDYEDEYEYEDDEYDEDEYEDDEYEDDDYEEDTVSQSYRKRDSSGEVHYLQEELRKSQEEIQRLNFKLSRVEEVKHQYNELQETYTKVQEELRHTNQLLHSKDSELQEVNKKLATTTENLYQKQEELKTQREKTSLLESQKRQLNEVGEILLEARTKSKKILSQANMEADAIRIVAQEDADKMREENRLRIQILRKEAYGYQTTLEHWREGAIEEMNRLIEKYRVIAKEEFNGEEE